MLVWKKTIINVAVATSVLLCGSAAHAADGIRFTDLSSHWAKASIEAAVEAGVVRGYPDGTFRPDANVSRAEFLAIVTRASELPGGGGEEPFGDVPDDHWAVDAIRNAIGMGFIDPGEFAGGQFEPDKALTRAEMVKWLVSGLSKADDSFAQALEDTKETILPFTEFYRGGFNKGDIPYIAVARGTELVGGFPDGSFGPDRTTTRAEVVVLLERYLAVEGTKAEEYLSLNELREVGTKGTNVVTIGAAKWALSNGVELPFYNVIGQELVPENQYGTLVLEKFLLIDNESKSVYADMFLSDEEQGEIRGTNNHKKISLVTLTPSKDLDINQFSNILPPITGSSFQTRRGMQDKYGFPALRNTGGNTQLDEGNTSTFWSISNMYTKGSLRVQTIDGTTGGFFLR